MDLFSDRSPRFRFCAKVLGGLAVLFLFGNPFLSAAFLEMWSYNHFDFAIFYEASVALAEGASPYAVHFLEEWPHDYPYKVWDHYVYPPLFARILYPFTFFSMLTARRVYVVLCTALYLWLLFPRGWKSERGGWERVMVLALVLSWEPTIETIRWAQSNFVVLFLVFAAWRFVDSTESEKRENADRWETVAGAFLGAASAIKLTPLLMLPLFIAGHRWRLVVGFLATFPIALAGPGPATFWEYATRVWPLLGGITTQRECPSIHVGVLRIFDFFSGANPANPETIGAAKPIALGVAAVVYAIAIVIVYRRREFTSRGNLVLLSCYVPPLLAARWPHHYMLALLPVLAAVRGLSGALRGDKKVTWTGKPTPDPPRFDRRSLPFSPTFLLVFLFAALSPQFYYFFRYWLFEREALRPDFMNPPVSFTSLSIWGHLIAFGIVLMLLTRSNNGNVADKDGRADAPTG